MAGWLCDALLTCSLSCLHHISLEQEANRLEIKSLSLKPAPSNPLTAAGSYLQKVGQLPPRCTTSWAGSIQTQGLLEDIFSANINEAFGHSSLWPAVTLLLVFFWVKGNPFFSTHSSLRSPNLIFLPLSFSKTCTFFFHNIYFDWYILLSSICPALLIDTESTENLSVL